MKKIILIATVMIGMITNANASTAETLRFASAAAYPPFEYLDAHNNIVGFDIDIAQALCQQMQVKCTFSHQVFDSLITSLRLKKYDAVISGMDITPERSKQVSFTQPYYANSAIVIAHKGYFSSIADLKGKRIGVQNGTTHQQYMQDKHPDIHIVSYDSYQNAILDLKNGRLDAVFGDTAAVNEWLKNDPSLATVGQQITDKQYFGAGLGIAVRRGNIPLLTRLNSALDAIKQNGIYDAIAHKWFPY